MDEDLRRLERRATLEPHAARALEHLRWRSGVAVCHVAHEGRTRRTCLHLLAPEYRDGYELAFTGRGSEHALVCGACPGGAVDTCPACVEAIEARCHATGWTGRPTVLERPSGLALGDAVTFELAGAEAVAPVRGTDRWAAFGNGVLRSFDARGASAVRVGVELTGPLDLHAEKDLVALVERHGVRGAVVERATGRVTMQLLRDEYCVQHCRFPFAFLEREGRLLAVHGTAWNRLDVSDPWTGERLTRSELVASPEQLGAEFHGALHVSPEGRWLLDDGWVWHPVGVLTAWSLESWLAGAGEDHHDLAQRVWFWDGAVRWLDGRTVAYWGPGDDADRLLDAVVIHSVALRKNLRFFVGPTRDAELVVERGLLVASGPSGFEVYDPGTGERLLRRTDFEPGWHHPDTGELLALEGTRADVRHLVGVA